MFSTMSSMDSAKKCSLDYEIAVAETMPYVRGKPINLTTLSVKDLESPALAISPASDVGTPLENMNSHRRNDGTSIWSVPESITSEIAVRGKRKATVGDWLFNTEPASRRRNTGDAVKRRKTTYDKPKTRLEELSDKCAKWAIAAKRASREKQMRQDGMPVAKLVLDDDGTDPYEFTPTQAAVPNESTASETGEAPEATSYGSCKRISKAKKSLTGFKVDASPKGCPRIGFSSEFVTIRKTIDDEKKFDEAAERSRDTGRHSRKREATLDTTESKAGETKSDGTLTATDIINEILGDKINTRVAKKAKNLTEAKPVDSAESGGPRPNNVPVEGDARGFIMDDVETVLPSEPKARKKASEKKASGAAERRNLDKIQVKDDDRPQSRLAKPANERSIMDDNGTVGMNKAKARKKASEKEISAPEGRNLDKIPVENGARSRMDKPANEGCIVDDVEIDMVDKPKTRKKASEKKEIRKPEGQYLDNVPVEDDAQPQSRLEKPANEGSVMDDVETVLMSKPKTRKKASEKKEPANEGSIMDDIETVLPRKRKTKKASEKKEIDGPEGLSQDSTTGSEALKKKRGRPPRRDRLDSDSTISSVVSKTSERSPEKSVVDRTIKICFTQMNDVSERKLESLKKAAKDLGAKTVDTGEECTHLVVPKIGRSMKFMCAVARGIPIVTPTWIEACKKAGTFLDTEDYIVDDKAAEKQLDFNLRQCLNDARNNKRFLHGYIFYSTRSVRPPADEMKAIIQCAGGTFLNRLPKSLPVKGRLVVISCKDDAESNDVWSAKKIHAPLVDMEFIFSGLLKRELNIEKYELFQDESFEKDTSTTDESKARQNPLSISGTQKSRSQAKQPGNKKE